MAQAVRISLVRMRRLPVALLAGASFVFIVPLAYSLNIWQDEAYTLHTTAHGVAFAFSQALAFEQNAPLYFVLLALWRHLGESVFFLRLFSVLCAAGTLALIPGIARRYLPHVDAGLVTIAVAWNPFFFWTALEMRAYAMIVFVSALLLVAFYDAFLAREPKRYAVVLYGVCAAAGLYTQYYLGFLVLAQFFVLCLYRRSSLTAFLLSADLAALTLAPLLTIIPQQVQNFGAPFAAPSWGQSFGVLAGIIAHYVLPLPIAHATAVYAILFGALIVALRVSLLSKRPLFTAAGEGILPEMTIAAVLVFAFVTHAGHVIVLSRHGASLYVPAVLSVFALLTFLRPDLRARAAIVWLCIGAAASTSVLVQTYAVNGAKPGDWLRVASALQQRETAGQPIAVFEAENALPFAYYYRGPNSITAIPSPVNFGAYDVTQFVVRDARQLRRAMPHAKRVWLITAGECASADLQFGCDVVERYVTAHYRTEYDASFYQSRLRLLRSL